MAVPWQSVAAKLHPSQKPWQFANLDHHYLLASTHINTYTQGLPDQRDHEKAWPTLSDRMDQSQQLFTPPKMSVHVSIRFDKETH